VSELEHAVRRLIRSELDARAYRTHYSVRDAARMLGWSESLVRKRIRLGRLEAVKADGWAVRIPVEEVERVLRERGE